MTPTHLLAYNPFIRYAVSRQAIRDVKPSWFVPRLLIDGHRPIRLAVLNRQLPGGMDYGSTHRQGRLIMRMIRDTPADADGAASSELSRRLRWGNLALAVSMAASVVGVYLSLR